MGYGCSKLDGSGSHEGQAGELVSMRLDWESSGILQGAMNQCFEYVVSG